MAELKEHEAVGVFNPTELDFTWRYNGEPYTIKAGESVNLAKPVAFLLAKHLSSRMVEQDEMKKADPKDLKNPNSELNVKISQLQVNDTHERRIALYKILGHEDLALGVILAFNFKGFIGDMDIYKKFVDNVKDKLNSSAAEENY